MKVFISLAVLFTLTACGKKIEDRSATKFKSNDKALRTAPELWSIHSDRVLPNKISVVINDMEFFNACTGLGLRETEIMRTFRNGTINITSHAAFRQDFFDIDIYDCKNSTVFFSQDYVDQMIIDHPIGRPIQVILRLRNH